MRVCVTGATGFVGGHLTRRLVERGDEVRVLFRDHRRLERLGDLEVERVQGDVLDRAAMRRAVRGCDLVMHCAGIVGARPAERIFNVNAIGPRVAVEAAAVENVGRVVVTSSVAGIGPVRGDQVGDETDYYHFDGASMTYPESKHEGEVEAFAAGARTGVEVVVVNPSYVLGVPDDRTQGGETSTRTIGNYLLGRLPAVVDGRTNIVDVDDVAAGHVLAAEKGRAGERYVLGGTNIGWVELIDKVAEISGVHHPLFVIPPEAAPIARAAESVGLGVRGFMLGEALTLMSSNWCYSSAKAKRELGYRPKRMDRTLRRTVEWYQELIEAGRYGGRLPVSSLTVGTLGMRLASRLGVPAALQRLEPHAGRRLVAGV